MNNYWLDRMSDRVGRAGQPSQLHHSTGFELPATYRVEIRLGHAIVVPKCQAKVVSRLDRLDVTFGDAAEFPLESYEWLATACNWGSQSGPPVAIRIKKYVGGRKVEDETRQFSVTGVSYNQTDEALEITIGFERA